MNERTLVLLKPDFVERERFFVRLLSMNNLYVVSRKAIQLDEELVCKLYRHKIGHYRWLEILANMLAGPCVVLVVVGENSCEKIRALKGKCFSGCGIRGKWATKLTSNLLHSSDNAQEANEEISLFW